jgi:hypothetical protein
MSVPRWKGGEHFVGAHHLAAVALRHRLEELADAFLVQRPTGFVLDSEEWVLVLAGIGHAFQRPVLKQRTRM